MTELSDILSYKKDPKLMLATAGLVLAAFVVYLTFFDILIPGLPNGSSYRSVVGAWFAVPCAILVLGQSFFAGFFIQMAAIAFKSARRDFLKAFFIASVVTFMFSLTYAMFPFYGPFYYIVFATGEAPWYALPVEIVWSLTTLSISAYLMRRMYSLSLPVSYFLSVIVVAGIVVAAS